MVVRYERPLRPDELYHFGILGMKWGVRRYQNPDGTLTAAGKKHYDSSETTASMKNDRSASTTTSASASQKTADDETPKKNGFKLTDKQKKAIKIGAAVVGTAVLAYGAYKVGERIKVNKAAERQLLNEAVQNSRGAARAMAESVVDGSVDSNKYKKYLHEDVTKHVNSKFYKSNKDRLVKKQLETNWHNREGKVINKVKNVGNPYANAFGGYTKRPDVIKKSTNVTKKDIANIPNMSADELKARDWWMKDKTSKAKSSGIKLDFGGSTTSMGNDYTNRILKSNQSLDSIASSANKKIGDTSVEDYTKELLSKASKKLK